MIKHIIATAVILSALLLSCKNPLLNGQTEPVQDSPFIVSHSFSTGNSGISIQTSSITITFSEAMGTGYSISHNLGEITLEWSSSNTLLVTMLSDLQYNQEYFLILNPSDHEPGFKDLKGNNLAADTEFRFDTERSPAFQLSEAYEGEYSLKRIELINDDGTGPITETVFDKDAFYYYRGLIINANGTYRQFLDTYFHTMFLPETPTAIYGPRGEINDYDIRIDGTISDSEDYLDIRYAVDNATGFTDDYFNNNFADTGFSASLSLTGNLFMGFHSNSAIQFEFSGPEIIISYSGVVTEGINSTVKYVYGERFSGLLPSESSIQNLDNAIWSYKDGNYFYAVSLPSEIEKAIIKNNNDEGSLYFYTYYDADSDNIVSFSDLQSSSTVWLKTFWLTDDQGAFDAVFNASSTTSYTGMEQIDGIFSLHLNSGGSDDFTGYNSDGSLWDGLSDNIVSSEPISVTGLSFDQSSVSLDMHTSQQLSVMILPANATNRNITWTSSDDRIAAVNDRGLVSAVSPGSVTITATSEDGNHSAHITVTINEPPDITAPGEVSNITISEGNGEVSLSWTNPADADFDRIGILYGIGSADTPYGGTIGTNSATITGLQNETQYLFLIQTIDTAGNRSTGIQVTATPRTPQPEIEVRVGNSKLDYNGTARMFYAMTLNDLWVDLVGARVSLSIEIRNRGEAVLSLDSINPLSITGEEASFFTIDSNPSSSILPGASETVTVSYHPNGSYFNSAFLNINSNDPLRNQFAINLYGICELEKYNGQTPGGYLDYGTEDWFYVHARAGRTYTLFFDDSGDDNPYTIDADVLISAYESDRITPYFENIDDPPATPLTITPDADGLIYLKVDGAASYSNGVYELGISSEGIAQISSYNHYTLFLKENGTIWASGTNTYGQFGNGTTDSSLYPLETNNYVKEIYTGIWHSGYLTHSRALYTVGNGDYGQLGDGVRTTRSTPELIMSDVLTASMGLYQTMIIDIHGDLYSTGQNQWGCAGLGTRSYTAAPIKIMSDVASVSAADNHTLILKNDQTVWSTGRNDNGQLGIGSTEDKSTPVYVMSNIRYIDAGNSYSMAISNDDNLWGFGWNGSGQLGDGTFQNRLVPTLVMSNVRMVSAGHLHTMVVKNDNTLWWMGNPIGAFGPSANAQARSPVYLMNDVESVSCGADSTFIIKTDGSVWTVGANDYGELGDGTTNYHHQPVQLEF